MISSFAFAQNSFQPVERALVDGFIILKSGERMEGRVQIQKNNLMKESVIFYDKINIKKTYKPEEIESYGLNVVLRNNDGDMKREWRSFETQSIKQEDSDIAIFVQGNSPDSVFMD